MPIDVQAIITRGYATEEEYEAAQAELGLNKLNIGDMVDGKLVNVEGLWVCPLEDDNQAGEKFKFIFFNDAVGLMTGPRPSAGMVGIAMSNGPDVRATATFEECLELFVSYGDEPTNYYNNL